MHILIVSSMWLQRERKDDVIWSDLKLGGHLELIAILFQSWSKITSNSKLPPIISRSSVSTYSILRQNLKVCCLMCTSWSSVNKCFRRRNAPLLESGCFAKYGDCWKRDKNISPKIPRPFPVARTQIVEPVLLLNLKLYTVLVLTWFSGVAD